jgi:pimeloyl-ACP methyl ester carboxylesterase
VSLPGRSIEAGDAAGADLDHVFTDDAPSGGDVFLKGIELRPGVTADIHLRVLSDPRPGCGREAIVAVHGSVSTASTLVGLGKALLASTGDGGARARWFIAVDLPGHGESAPPVGVLFGDLALQDYVAAIVGTLDRLKGRGIRATTLVGHSLGGATLLQVQQSLIHRGKSLEDVFDVEHVVLLSPGAWPDGISCAKCQDPHTSAIIRQFTVVDPTLGLVLRLPATVYQVMIWSRPDGSLAPNAPTPAQIAADRYVSDESLIVAADVPRATFDAGIFGRGLGTKLDVVSFQHDTLVMPDENKALYAYATGESPEHGWTTVEGPNAVHGMPVSDPVEMLAAIERLVKLA